MAFEMGDGGDIIIDNEQLENLDQAEINTRLDLVEGKTEDYAASAKLAKFESEMGEKFNFALSRKPEEDMYYLVDRNSGDDINSGYSLDQLDELFDVLQKVLAEKGDVKLVGGEDWRAIKKNDIIEGEALVYSGVKYDAHDSIKAESNNKVEEIFRFTQSIQGIPESNWKIEDKINEKSGPIGVPRKKAED